MELAALILGVLSCALVEVQGAIFARSKADLPSIQEKPFAWLLNTESWNNTDPASIIPKATVTTCGGYISGLDNALTNIFYEPTGGFVANERCVWVLHSHLSTIDVYTDVQSSTAGINGLIMNHFTATGSSTTMAVDRIPTTNLGQYNYPNYNGVSYLMFSSNEIGRGTGVRLAVRARGSGNTALNHNAADPYKTSSGSLNMAYRNSAIDTYLFQPLPTVHTSISITFLDLENANDNLRVFTLLPYHTSGNTITAISWTGFYPFGPPNSETASEEPRLYLLHTDASVTKDGVSLAWRSP